MAAYDGYQTIAWDSDARSGQWHGDMRQYRSRITTAKPHAGLNSLEILPGGRHDVYYGCAAGSTTITVQCWPPVGAGVGKCAIEVTAIGTEEILARTEAVWTGAWEQLSVTFASLKAVYRVRLVNRTRPSGDTRAYFDDLV